MKNICKEINYSFRTSKLSFFCYKAIEAIYAYLGIFAAIIVMFIGIKSVERKEDYPVFCVATIFLIVCLYRGITSWLMTEGLMISFVRCDSVINFESEKDEKTEED